MHRWRFLFVFFLLARFGTTDTLITWKDLQANIDSWPKGPVSLILTDDERAVYKKLKTPEEKMQFIKIFWARRDPILRTRENEFKQEFYDRVAYADQNFGEGKNPGWMSARGQVYILFGKPSREEKRLLSDSDRPALLWVYDRIPSTKFPANEALLFLYHDFKYVLAPPNPDPGDVLGANRRQIEESFRYQSIPSVVQEAFADVSKTNIVDEDKNYKSLLYSVSSTEKFGVNELNFDINIMPGHPPSVEAIIPAEKAPVYDDGNKIFAEFLCKVELRQNGTVVSTKEHLTSLNWDQKTWSDLKEIRIPLPKNEASGGSYELSVTVRDNISGIAETKKVPISY